jgi:hypothetical protein
VQLLVLYHLATATAKIALGGAGARNPGQRRDGAAAVQPVQPVQPVEATEAAS